LIYYYAIDITPFSPLIRRHFISHTPLMLPLAYAIDIDYFHFH